jgi:hypothetical protein
LAPHHLDQALDKIAERPLAPANGTDRKPSH